jgi:hypothetical protein
MIVEFEYIATRPASSSIVLMGDPSAAIDSAAHGLAIGAIGCLGDPQHSSGDVLDEPFGARGGIAEAVHAEPDEGSTAEHGEARRLEAWCAPADHGLSGWNSRGHRQRRRVASTHPTFSVQTAHTETIQ